MVTSKGILAVGVLALWAACGEPPSGHEESHAAASLSQAYDAGTNEVIEPGHRVLGRTNGHYFPALLMRWEDPHLGVLKLGEGQPGFVYSPTRVLQLDASWKTTFMLSGRAVAKLENHPTLGRPLLHLSEVSSVYFGNTNYRDVEFLYQGAALAGDGEGFDMLIRGQSVNAARFPETTSLRGGDVTIAGGDASAPAPYEIPLDAGELILRGGRRQSVTAGNVAIGDPPSEWGDAEGAVWVDDALTPPTTPQPGGGYLFAKEGALYWMGSRGTVTLVAPP